MHTKIIVIDDDDDSKLNFESWKERKRFRCQSKQSIKIIEKEEFRQNLFQYHYPNFPQFKFPQEKEENQETCPIKKMINSIRKYEKNRADIPQINRSKDRTQERLLLKKCKIWSAAEFHENPQAFLNQFAVFKSYAQNLNEQDFIRFRNHFKQNLLNKTRINEQQVKQFLRHIARQRTQLNQMLDDLQDEQQ